MSSVSDTAVSEPYGPPLSSADRVMHKILRLPLNPERISADAARKAMQTSLLVSTVRCLLQYIILPVVFPAVGLAGGVGDGVGHGEHAAGVVDVEVLDHAGRRR
jgi:hypothetical protein